MWASLLEEFSVFLSPFFSLHFRYIVQCFSQWDIYYPIISLDSCKLYFSCAHNSLISCSTYSCQLYHVWHSPDLLSGPNFFSLLYFLFQMVFYTFLIPLLGFYFSWESRQCLFVVFILLIFSRCSKYIFLDWRQYHPFCLNHPLPLLPFLSALTCLSPSRKISLKCKHITPFPDRVRERKKGTSS